jgi:signal transduction histidine kinase
LAKCQIQPHPVKFSPLFHSQWFIPNTETTIEEAFVSKAVTINKLKVWNTDRSEKYQSLASMNYRDALVVIVVLTSQVSHDFRTPINGALNSESAGSQRRWSFWQ